METKKLVRRMKKGRFEDTENGFVNGDSSIVRRSFLKRSGGVTAASMLSWQTRAFAGGEDNNDIESSDTSDKLKLWCKSEPAPDEYDKVWPGTFQGAKRHPEVYDDTSRFSWQRTYFNLHHWVEFDAPKQKDNKPVVGHSLKGQATAHCVLTRLTRTRRNRGTSRSPRFTYGWVQSTEKHLTAGGQGPNVRNFEVFTTGDENAPEIDFEDMNDEDIQEVHYDGKLIGWVLLSIWVEDFVLRSDALFVPRTYVENSTWTFGGNLSGALGFGESGSNISGGINGSYSQTLKTNQEPPGAALSLEWKFITAKNGDGIDDPVDWDAPAPGPSGQIP